MATTYTIKCNGINRTVKSAGIGGDGNKQSFEQALAYIARKYIQDNAPSLMQYEQGFQLLEKNDDDTKAVGVLGFNVNQMQVYCPVFFLNGELKGNELMYLADQDLFIPVKEEWLNKIMGRRPITIGEGIDKNTHRQGYTQPDLRALKDAPVKLSSFYPNWLLKALPTFFEIRGNSFEKSASNMVRLYKAMRQSLNVMNFVKEADAAGVYGLKEAIKKQPFIKQAWDTVYGNSEYLDRIYNHKDIKEGSLKILNESSSFRQLPDGTPVGGYGDSDHWIPDFIRNPIYKNSAYVSIISYSATIDGGPDFPLTEDEKERLVRDGHVVLDSRKDSEVSKVIAKTGKSLINPSESGIYAVLMDDGDSKPCCVCTGSRGNLNKDEALVVEIGSNNFIVEKRNKVWCTKKYERSYDEGLSEVPSTLHTRDGISSDFDSGSEYIFISPTAMFGPLKIKRELGVMDGRRQYSAEMYLPSCISDSISSINEVVIGEPAGSSLRNEGGILHVPTDCKYMRIVGNMWDNDSKLRLGDPHLQKIAGYGNTEEVKLHVDGDTCYINGKPQESAFSGFCSLIKDFGLREKAAKKLMKEAASSFAQGNTIRFSIKRAADDPRLSPESNFTFPAMQENASTGIMGSYLPGAPSDTQAVTEPTNAHRPGTGPYENSLSPSFPMQDAQAINKAIQNGQQEVFDVSMLKQLLRNVNTSDMLEALATKLTRAMHNIGKLLFLFYWKGDDFKEIYGQQELPELEGCLRKAFETVGDIILFLQRQGTKPITYTGERAIDLSSIDD